MLAIANLSSDQHHHGPEMGVVTVFSHIRCWITTGPVLKGLARSSLNRPTGKRDENRASTRPEQLRSVQEQECSREDPRTVRKNHQLLRPACRRSGQ